VRLAEVLVRLRLVFCLAALAAALGGCAGQQGVNKVAAPVTTPTIPVWTEPKQYSYTLESTCGERTLIGKFAVTVTDGLVTKTVGLDASSRRALMLRLSRLVPTLAQMAAEAETARAAGADEVVIQHDPADGHPVSIRIDPSRNTADDESCYQISAYKAG
jgi:hypothetical protein